MRKRLTLVVMMVLALAMIGTSLTYAGGRRQQRGNRAGAALTDEQRAEVKAMRESGASREEISAKLQEYGVDVPEKKGQRQRSGNGAELTEEQRAEIKAMRESGATREEIRAKLQEYGVDAPEKKGQRQGSGNRAELTEEQRAEIKAKVQEMKEAGASSKEIREAVRDMVQPQAE